MFSRTVFTFSLSFGSMLPSVFLPARKSVPRAGTLRAANHILSLDAQPLRKNAGGHVGTPQAVTSYTSRCADHKATGSGLQTCLSSNLMMTSCASDVVTGNKVPDVGSGSAHEEIRRESRCHDAQALLIMIGVRLSASARGKTMRLWSSISSTRTIRTTRGAVSFHGLHRAEEA